MHDGADASGDDASPFATDCMPELDPEGTPKLDPEEAPEDGADPEELPVGVPPELPPTVETAPELLEAPRLPPDEDKSELPEPELVLTALDPPPSLDVWSPAPFPGPLGAVDEDPHDTTAKAAPTRNPDARSACARM